MKLKFKTQDFQTDAVNAVADLFAGQNKQTTTFSIIEEHHGQQISLKQNEFGIGNTLNIQASVLSIKHSKNLRIKSFQLNSCIMGGELPVYLGTFNIAC